MQQRAEQSPSPFPIPQLRSSDSMQNPLIQAEEKESLTLTGEEEDDDRVEEFKLDDDGGSYVGDDHSLRPGDLVELMTSREPVLAFFVRNFEYEAQFYTMQGKWVHAKKRSGLFHVPHLISPLDLDPIRCFLPSAPVAPEALNIFQTLDADVPRERGALLIKKLKSFYHTTNELFRANSERLGRAYEVMAHTTEVRYASLPEIAMKVLQKRHRSELTNEMLWAVHKTLYRLNGFYPDVSNHRKTQRWEIRSHTTVRELARVAEWLREYSENNIARLIDPISSDSTKSFGAKDSNPISGFVDKARALVKKSRKSRPATNSFTLGPRSNNAKVQNSDKDQNLIREKFTSKESLILKFLKDWCLDRAGRKSNSFVSIGPMILRHIGMYKEFELGPETGYLLLQEIGVIAPWEDAFLYNQRLPTPGSFDPKTKKLEEKAEESIALFRSGKRGLKDSMAGLRRDWGALPVYCIDSAGALDIDDGISLERIDGNNSEYWVHVHIANPSAFIGPDDAIARFAAFRGETIYLPEESYAMLSPSITQQYFSLANGRPSLTFSARLTTGGEILATKITPGFVENVLFITPQELGRLLGANQDISSQSSKTLIVGDAIEKLTMVNKTVDLTALQIADLRKLNELGRARSERRSGLIRSLLAPSIAFGNKLTPRVYFKEGSSSQTFSDRVARRYDEDPSISCEVQIQDTNVEADPEGSQSLVPNMMVLAGEIAAAWSSERDIPICYRGMRPIPATFTTPEAFHREVISPFFKTHGYISPADRIRYNRLLGEVTLSVSPLEHVLLGLKAYARVTSPLRRYGDLLNHWQIEHALRLEDLSDSSLISTGFDDYSLPFPKPILNNVLRDLEHQEQTTRGIIFKAHRHWIFQLLFRAFYFKEAKLPETFGLYVARIEYNNARGSVARGKLRELGALDVALADAHLIKREGGVALGDLWETKISHIDCFQAEMLVEPVRLISREREPEGRLSS
ncbi:MAG: hypothetical protein Q9190_002045 [Brigantiaea leucoxantha]